MPCCQLIAKIVFLENNKGKDFLAPVTEDRCAIRKSIAMHQYSANSKRLFPFTVSSSFQTVRKLKFPIRTKFLLKSVLTSKKWIKIWDYMWPLHVSLPGGSVQTDSSSCVTCLAILSA